MALKPVRFQSTLIHEDARAASCATDLRVELLGLDEVEEEAADALAQPVQHLGGAPAVEQVSLAVNELNNLCSKHDVQQSHQGAVQLHFVKGIGYLLSSPWPFLRDEVATTSATCSHAVYSVQHRHMLGHQHEDVTSNGRPWPPTHLAREVAVELLDRPLDVQQHVQPLVHVEHGQVEPVVELHELLGARGEGRVHVHLAAVLELHALGLAHGLERALDAHLLVLVVRVDLEAVDGLRGRRA